MIFAVIDTNVLVSALLTANPLSATRLILDKVIDGEITPLYDEEILAEYKEVLSRPKFHFSQDLTSELVDFIREIGVSATRSHFDEIMPDESDRVFYEITLTMEESFLVTGNLKHYPGTPQVVSPAKFLSLLNETK